MCSDSYSSASSYSSRSRSRSPARRNKHRQSSRKRDKERERDRDRRHKHGKAYRGEKQVYINVKQVYGNNSEMSENMLLADDRGSRRQYRGDGGSRDGECTQVEYGSDGAPSLQDPVAVATSHRSSRSVHQRRQWSARDRER